MERETPAIGSEGAGNRRSRFCLVEQLRLIRPVGPHPPNTAATSAAVVDLTDPDRLKPGNPELFLATAGDDVEPAFSPDAHLLAYTSAESGGNQVYVRPFPPTAGAGKWQVSTEGGRFPIWSRTSKELFYAAHPGTDHGRFL